MTTRREWPNVAKWARDDAAAEGVQIIRKAQMIKRKVKNGQFTRSELVILALEIENHALNAVRKLESVGAETRQE